MPLFRKIASFCLLALVGFGLAGCDDDDDGTGIVLLNAPSLSAEETDAGVVLTWTSVTGATTYRVQRGGEGGALSTIADNLSATTYTDTDVSPGTAYTYVVVAQGADDSEASNPVTVVIEEVITEVAVSGQITGSRTFHSDTTYILRGIVSVEDGGVLTIQPGTLILGDANTTPTALLVKIGGKIMAEGTANAPIVFTSSNPVGTRSRGDWGGIVINGDSNCNFPRSAGDRCVSEGVSSEYGNAAGTEPDIADNSGILKYVRIEYAGYEVSLGNEVNALTLNGVGNGTVIDYVQAHMGDDDGIELFGGTVNISHALVTGAQDDSFDYSTGWQGYGQFWLALQDPDDVGQSDTGFEVDGNEDEHTATPITNPTLFNVALIGNGTSIGMRYRRGTAGTVANSIVTGFTDGLRVDDPTTVGLCSDDTFNLMNVLFFNNDDFLHNDAADSEENTCLAAWTEIWSDPAGLNVGLASAADWTTGTMPDLVPAADLMSQAGLSAADLPGGDWFAAADYIGAIEPGTETPWIAGWTTWDRN